MGIGIGIFLGLSLCGIIYLYTQTKNDWNWIKIFKRMVIVFLSLILVPALIFGIFLGYEVYKDNINQKPKKITSLDGVNLGDSLSDVKFRVPLVRDEDLSNSWKKEVYATTNNNSDRNYVFNTEGKLIQIVQWCFNKKGQLSIAQIMNGITCFNKGEEIESKYGKNSIRILCNKEIENSRAYDATNYGIRYVLDGNSVTSIWLFDSNEFRDSKSSHYWIPCNEIKDQSKN